jgi:Spy/CpxP family protein refolding chaperone
MNPVCSRPSSSNARLRRWALAAALLLAIAAAIPRAAAQDDTPPPPPEAPPTNRAANGGPRSRGNYSPEAMLEALRKRLGVTDDAEWSVIAARITAVRTLQRSTGAFGGFRGGGGGNPEQQALREAISDQLPDAEIKARLERFRAVRKENQAKLDQARADLAAVLTVRQEAMLVMLGLLQ